ncbi:uncharacterized protein F4812DRAFT_456843 [Daldinia caldariorum]|uniref:uncharacterized protein n=1 Tax=Daldinia caldariorum TaxID=326644 RepID=UPI00200774F6|nr:uncharacterized protein F4812DRAFT_456843 [Daldinia caldariorum]KAI1470830.1 hypothetical protein F4812DRAFT_456843 [Daldinia caldariorum]
MAATADMPSREPPPTSDTGRLASILKKLLGKDSTLTSSVSSDQESRTSLDCSPTSGLLRKVSRKVVPGLPRVKTFKRQQSEVREKLEAIQPTSAERRAVSVDRRLRTQRSLSRTNEPLPRASAPDFFFEDTQPSIGPPTVVSHEVLSASESPLDEKQFLSLQDTNSVNSANLDRENRELLQPAPSYLEALSPVDVQSTTTSQYDAMINDELERKWILNLSMHFRDKSKREKFFVTYREHESVWRRVTISLDYRNAPDDSLEKDLLQIKFQREKSAKIYEAIRESLQDIQFYSTVTNLKLQTTEGRLHVHVVEDVNEIINYPTVRMIQHLKCRRVRERDLAFESHMSGFVYKVRVAGQTLIKKEIPGPDTVDEFLYEVNALNSLHFSRNVIEFYGVIVDDEDEMVKGLLINYAEKGALIDLIYDSQEDGRILPWSLREKWARQIVQGLSDVHEAGFVQGDLTLSNIVIDYEDNAKIIDINRRGCPVGWEPPEATALIDSNQRISMYIGVKSDLYQLGMVLWALATLEDEPEAHRRPLRLASEIDVPDWYRTMVEYCLHEDPRVRVQASILLRLFPQPVYSDDYDKHDLPSISVDDGNSLREYTVDGYEDNGHPHVKAAQLRDVWPYTSFSNTHVAPTDLSVDQYYPSRGRSPARSLPSDHNMYRPPYTEQHDMWTNFMDPYTAGLELGQEIAETPRRMQAPEEIFEEVQRDLEAGLAQMTGNESQTKVPASVTSANNAIRIDDENTKGALPLPVTGTAAITLGDTHTSNALGEESSLKNPRSGSKDDALEQLAIAQPNEPPGGVHTTTIPVHSQIDEAIHPHADGDKESESFQHYTHDRDVSTQSTATSSFQPPESPPQGMPTELTGVGSKYDHDEIRKMTLDDDLGLATTTTATAATNVTSQA